MEKIQQGLGISLTRKETRKCEREKGEEEDLERIAEKGVERERNSSVLKDALLLSPPVRSQLHETSRVKIRGLPLGSVATCLYCTRVHIC